MANNVFQVKRTNTSGRTPNTTGSYATNSQYIAAGEFALNMADGILYSSNGSAVIEVGANNTNQRITNSLTINNARNLNFQTVNTSAAVYFTQQNDDNFVLYSTNTAYGARPVFGVFANSITSNLQIYIPLQLNSGVVANNSLGSAGQVLTTNSTGVYWSSVGGTGTVTSVATGNGMTGGPITTTGTVSILANNGITANSTGTFVTQGTGVVVNATGVHVNAAYINTIAANSATFVLANNGIISNSTGVFVNGNNGLITNSTGVHVRANSGIVANATGTFVLANNGIIANATGVFVNGNNGLITNSTGVHVLANSGIIANSTGTFVNGNTGVVVNSTGVFVNATYIGTISANNASFLGGVAAASYQTTAGLAGNVATLTANNTSFVGTVSAANVVSNAQLSGNLANYVTTTNLTNNLANYQTTAGLSANVATLTANNASFLGGVAAASYVNTSGSYTITGVHTYNANIVIGTSAGISANGGFGTAGQVLHSNGTSVYWAADDNSGGTVTSVATGNGMTGGAITTTGTVSVLANTGIVANSTGLFVNATYIGTISANNASFLGGVAAASYVNTSGAYTLTGIHTHTANLVVNAAIIAGGNSGSAGQVLTSNGSGNVYWSTITSGGVNTAASYTWTNTQIFTANVTVNAAIIAGGTSGTAGQLLASNGTSNVYWTDVPVYMKGGSSTIGTLAAGGTNIFRVNANTLNYNTTIATGENAQATGPLSVASGITLTVETGARVAIL